MSRIFIYILLFFPLSLYSEDKILNLNDCKALFEEGKYEQIFPYLRPLIDDFQGDREWNEDDFGDAVLMLGTIYTSRNDYASQLQLYTDALNIFHKKSHDANTELSRILWNMAGRMEMELKDYRSAIMYLEKAQWLYEDKSIYKDGYFSVLSALGGCYLHQKDFVNAQLYLDEAEEIHLEYIGRLDEFPYPLSFQLLNFRGLLATALRNTKYAEECFTTILNSFKDDVLLQPIKDIARINLANLYTQTERYDEAIEIFNSTETCNSSVEYYKYQNMVFHALLTDNTAQAVEYQQISNERAFRYMQNIILGITETEKEYYWTEMADQLTHNNNFLAFWTKDRRALRNGFEINSFARDFTIDFQQIIKTQYLSHPNEDKSILWNDFQKNKDLLSYEPQNTPRHDSIALKVIELERNILSHTDISLYDFFRNRFDIKQLSEELQENDIIVDFIYMSHANDSSAASDFSPGIAAYILTSSDSVPSIVDLCSQEQLYSLIYSQKRDELFINELYRDKSDSVYNLIIAPLTTYIKKAQRIYIRPVGLLSTLNIGAIRMPDGNLFGKAYDIHIVSSFGNIGKTESHPYTSIAAFGCADYSSLPATSLQELTRLPSMSEEFAAIKNTTRGNWTALPGTKIEVNDIATLAADYKIPATVYLGEDASESSLKTMSGHSPSILHLATHGYFIENSVEAKGNSFLKNITGYSWSNYLMMYSGLLFSGANEVWNGKACPNPVDDGILTADEISRLDLSQTDLVVLSACDSGRGHFNGTDGIMGLQRAFRTAGAGTVVISLWKIPDLPTAKLMTLFYKYLFLGSSVREALENAQSDLIKDGFTDPYYWASFIVID